MYRDYENTIANTKYNQMVSSRGKFRYVEVLLLLDSRYPYLKSICSVKCTYVAQPAQTMETVLVGQPLPCSIPPYLGGWPFLEAAPLSML